jgi:hypothetical protein
MKTKFSLFSIILIITLLFVGCTKNIERNIRTPFSEEKRINDLVNASNDPNVPLNDEATSFTDEQIVEIYRNQNIWTLEEIESVIRDRNSSFEQKYVLLSQKIERNNLESTIESFSKRQTGYIQDSNPNHLAQMIAAAGSIVGVKSSLNIFRPINDNGTVTFFDIYIAERRQVAQPQDKLVEYLPESVVFEYQVSGGNWLIAADIVTNFGVIPDTIHYCFDCPNGSLIWNPTLNSPADDDVIEGALPFNIVSISSNGLVPPTPLD